MKHRFFRRGAALFCGAVLSAATLFSLPSAALTLPHAASSAYGKSGYAAALGAIPKTGDGAFDAVAVALTQIGYHEGNGTAELGGGNTTGNGNFTEYNYANGKIGGTYGYAWCATFASFCLDAAGAKSAAGGKFASCTLWLARLKEEGRFRTRASGYTPREGDLIFFRSAGATRDSDHVGLVRAAEGGRVYTIEGNASNSVCLRDYALSDTYIVGYGTPDYGGKRLSKSHAAGNGGTAGYYIVTGANVNLRERASTASARCGAVSRGELLVLNSFEKGFGKTVKNGKTVCVSLQYVTFVSPLVFTVRTENETGRESGKITYFSTETPPAAPDALQKEGFSFAGWKASNGKTYAPGAALPSGDLLLTAAFSPLPEEAEREETENAPRAKSAGETFDAPEAPSDTNGQSGAGDLARGRTRAARAAGVVTFLSALAAGGIAFFTRRREW